jgi:hypothetical protein
MCCSCCTGENDAWCFKIALVICTSVSEKWDLPILPLKISALEARQKNKNKQTNPLGILHQIVIQERGGRGRYFISSAQNYETKTAPETKEKSHFDILMHDFNEVKISNELSDTWFV